MSGKISNPKNLEQCIFCEKYNAFHSFGPLLNKALYSKYSSSQNYFYSKEINDILEIASTAAVIAFRDLELIDEEEEYLKRGYPSSQICHKLTDLTEYYKYHKDIPRLFMPKIGKIMTRFSDKRRRIEYDRIKKELNLETSENANQKDDQNNESFGEQDDDLEEEEDDEENDNTQSKGNKNQEGGESNKHKNKEEAKKQKLKEALKDCENLLQNLDLTSSFHQRMKSRPPKTIGIYAPRTDFNPFYMYCHPNGNKILRKEDPNFDLSSFLHKLSNSSFFNQSKQQSQQPHKQQRQLPSNFNYQFEQKSTKQKVILPEEANSYALSSLLYQSNSELKQFYASEASLSNMSIILRTDTSSFQICIGTDLAQKDKSNVQQIGISANFTKKRQDQSEDSQNKLSSNQLKVKLDSNLGKQVLGTISKPESAQQQLALLNIDGQITVESTSSNNNKANSNILVSRSNNQMGQLVMQPKQSFGQKDFQIEKINGIIQQQKQQEQFSQQILLSQAQKAQQNHQAVQELKIKQSIADSTGQLTPEDLKDTGFSDYLAGIVKTNRIQPEKTVQTTIREGDRNHQKNNAFVYKPDQQQIINQQTLQKGQSLDQLRVQQSSSENSNNNQPTIITGSQRSSNTSSTSQKILQKRASDKGNIVASLTTGSALQNTQGKGTQMSIANQINFQQSQQSQSQQNNIQYGAVNTRSLSNGNNYKSSDLVRNFQSEKNSVSQASLIPQQSVNSTNLDLFFDNNNNNNNNNNNGYQNYSSNPTQQLLSNQFIQLSQLNSYTKQAQQLQKHLTQKKSMEGNSGASQSDRRYQTAERERMLNERKEFEEKLQFSNAQLNETKLSPFHQAKPKQALQSMPHRQSDNQIFSNQYQQNINNQKQQQLTLHSPQQSAIQLKDNHFKVMSHIKQPSSSRPHSSLHQASSSIGHSNVLMSSQGQEAFYQTRGQQQNALMMQSGSSQNLISSRMQNLLGSPLQQQQQYQQYSQAQQLLHLSASLQSQSQQQSLSQTKVNVSDQNPEQNLSLLNAAGVVLNADSQYQQSYNVPPPPPQQQQQQQQMASRQPQISQRNNSQTTSGDLRIKKRKEGQTFLSSNNCITNIGSSMVSAFGSNSKSLSTTLSTNLAASANSSKATKQYSSQQPQQRQEQFSSVQANNNALVSSSSLPVSPQLSFHQPQQMYQVSSQFHEKQQEQHTSNFFNSKRNSAAAGINFELIRTHQPSKGSLTVVPTKNRSSSNPKTIKQEGQGQSIAVAPTLFLAATNSNSINNKSNNNNIINYNNNNSNNTSLQPELTKENGSSASIFFSVKPSSQEQRLPQQIKHSQQQVLADQRKTVNRVSQSNQPENSLGLQKNISLRNNKYFTAGVQANGSNSNSNSNKLSSNNGINSKGSMQGAQNNKESNQLIKAVGDAASPINQENYSSQQSGGYAHSNHTWSQELIQSQANSSSASTARTFLNHREYPSEQNSQSQSNSTSSLATTPQQQLVSSTARGKAVSTHVFDPVKRLMEPNTITSTAQPPLMMVSRQQQSQFQLLQEQQLQQQHALNNLQQHSLHYYQQQQQGGCNSSNSWSKSQNNNTNSPVSIHSNQNITHKKQHNSNFPQGLSSARTEPLQGRVSNIANIFDSQSSKQSQFQQQSGQASLNVVAVAPSFGISQSSSSLSNLMSSALASSYGNSSIPVKNHLNNINNSNSYAKKSLTHSNSGHSHNPLSSYQSPLNTSNKQNNNICINNNNGSMPGSGNLGLNIKTLSVNHSSIGSLSRNNSPSRQKQICDNVTSGQQSQPAAGIESLIAAAFNSPQQNQSINTFRVGSNQRGATKASSLIRFRQHP